MLDAGGFFENIQQMDGYCLMVNLTSSGGGRSSKSYKGGSSVFALADNGEIASRLTRRPKIIPTMAGLVCWELIYT